MKTPAEIKKWLRDTGKSRTWLGKQCYVVKSTVDGWLSRGKTIPAAKMAIIESLMSAANDSDSIADKVVVQFNEQQMAIVKSFTKKFPNISLEEYMRMKAIELAASLTDEKSIAAAAAAYRHGDLIAAEDDTSE